MAKKQSRPARQTRSQSPAQPPPPSARGRLLALVGAAIALVALAGWWWSRGAAFTIAPTPDRNVLLVSIDTLRADVVGSYGGRALTPNVDRLAEHGARFTFAHSHAVVTRASHASMLTGRWHSTAKSATFTWSMF